MSARASYNFPYGGEPFYREITLEEWEHIIQQAQEGERKNDTVIIGSVSLLSGALVVIAMAAVASSKAKQKKLIKTMFVFLLGLLLYLPCFFLVKYCTETYRLYMSLFQGFMW